MTIPDGITKIGEKAFSDCQYLTSVAIPDGVTIIEDNAFYNCKGLKSMTIPNGMVSIGKSAFSGCGSLESITLPDSITAIKESAFSDCAKLETITIPNSVKTIGKSAFLKCSDLKEVAIPDSVESIEEAAFKECDSLTEITISDAVKSIGTSAFEDCAELLEVTVGCDTVGENAFYSCSKLKRVTIKPSVNHINKGAFEYCGSITNVYIDDLSAWCKIQFDRGQSSSSSHNSTYGCNPLNNSSAVLYIGKDDEVGVSDLEFTEEDGITKIGECAFASYQYLKSVSILSGVKIIDKYAFADCTIDTVKIGGSVERINECAFGGSFFGGKDYVKNVYILDLFAWCKIDFIDNPLNATYDGRYSSSCKIHLGEDDAIGITELTISDGVTQINALAFYGCQSLESVTIPKSVVNIGDDAFTLSHPYTAQGIFGDKTFVYYDGTESEWNNIVKGRHKFSVFSTTDPLLYWKSEKQ